MLWMPEKSTDEVMWGQNRCFSYIPFMLGAQCCRGSLFQVDEMFYDFLLQSNAWCTLGVTFVCQSLAKFTVHQIYMFIHGFPCQALHIQASRKCSASQKSSTIPWTRGMARVFAVHVLWVNCLPLVFAVLLVFQPLSSLFDGKKEARQALAALEARWSDRIRGFHAEKEEATPGCEQKQGQDGLDALCQAGFSPAALENERERRSVVSKKSSKTITRIGYNRMP